MRDLAHDTDPHWLTLLRAEVDRTSKAATGRRLGYARTTISLAYHGRYPGSTDRLEAKVLAVLADEVTCPATGEPMSREEFERILASPMPTSNPKALRRWLAIRQAALKTPS